MLPTVLSIVGYIDLEGLLEVDGASKTRLWLGGANTGATLFRQLALWRPIRRQLGS